jgi:hypothetical protein
MVNIGRFISSTRAANEAAGRSFALDVGIIPTEDAKVVETHELLARLHGQICCLVDGDGDGDRYIGLLRQHATPPVHVLRWPNGWDIEETVGWILRADEQAIIAMLDTLDGPPASVGDVVALLRAKKANVIVYEALAEAIAQTEPCAERAKELLTAMVTACAGEVTPRFVANPAGTLVFVP